MKTLLILSLLAGFAAQCRADIQDPPANDQGPTRKLGRGLANVTYGVAEFPHTIGKINTEEGNSAAASYGVVKGVGRTFARFGAGVFEIVTFPFPAVRGGYGPILPNEIPWIHRGYAEFPPELGYETKYPYVREY